MARGTLKWFNRVSDYGFVGCDDEGADRYVRGENISGGLAAGCRVEYDACEGGMGPEAINVRRIDHIQRRTTGSFEAPRRHGHFDPRFRPRRVLTPPSTRDVEVAASTVEGWESEGGAVTAAAGASR